MLSKGVCLAAVVTGGHSSLQNIAVVLVACMLTVWWLLFASGGAAVPVMIQSYKEVQ